MKNYLAQAHHFGMIQNELEVLNFLNWFEAQNCRRLLEVGTHTGGFLYLLIETGPPKGMVISVDLPWQSHEYSQGEFRKVYQERVHFLVGNSHAPETFRRVLQLAPVGTLDFIFLDGDHSFAGVKLDFEVYAPLIRPGGWIGFHDINNGHPCGDYYWDVAINDRAHVEFGFGRTFGIGCVQI